MPTKLSLLLTLPIWTACVSLDDVANDLESWHGAPASELQQAWDQPTETVATPQGNTLRYEVQGGSVSRAAVHGIDRTKKFCEVTSKADAQGDRKSTRLNSSHIPLSRMPSSA